MQIYEEIHKFVCKIMQKNTIPFQTHRQNENMRHLYRVQL